MAEKEEAEEMEESAAAEETEAAEKTEAAEEEEEHLLACRLCGLVLAHAWV